MGTREELESVASTLSVLETPAFINGVKCSSSSLPHLLIELDIETYYISFSVNTLQPLTSRYLVLPWILLVVLRILLVGWIIALHLHLHRNSFVLFLRLANKYL